MAGKDNNIGIKISTDVADLKSGIKSIKDEISSADKEFQKATAGLDKWSTSSEGLEAKLTQLNTKLSSQKKSVELYQAEIERVSKLEGDHSAQLETLKSKLESAEIQVKKTEREINHYSTSLEDVAKKEKEADTELGKLTKTISEQEDELKDLQTEYKNAVITYGKNSKEAKSLKGDIEKLSNELEDNKKEVQLADKQLELLDKQFDETADSAEQFSKGLDGIKGLGSKVAGGLATIGAGVGALAGAFLATAEGTREYRNNMAKLETGFTEAGLTAEDATNTFKEMYSILGDEGQATEATAFLAKFADDEKELASATHTLTGIYATFGASLPLEGLTEAINHTSSLGSVQGNLADALEWSGVNVDDFNEQLLECSDEEERQALIMDTLSGIYDDAGDKYKEINKDVIDSNKAQANLTETMAKLGEKAEPILTVVKDGFNQLLQEVLKLTEGVDFESLADSIEGAFQYAIDTILPAIKDGLQWILDNKDILIAGIVAIGTGMLAWNVVSMIQGIVGAVKAWTVATEGMTVAQRLMNLAMSANPIGIVITAITALVTAFVILWNKCDAFRQFWIDLWEGIKTAIGVVVNWIKENWQGLALLLVSWWAGAFKLLYDNCEWFRNIVDTILQKVKEYFFIAVEYIKKIWGVVSAWFVEIGSKIADGFKIALDKVKEFFSNTWNKIKEVWSTVSTWFTDIVSKVVDTFRNIPTKIKDFFSNAWTNVKNAWSNPKEFFSNVIQNIINTFKELPSKMLTVGSDLVEGLWNGINNMASWVSDKIKGFTGDILGGIKKFFGIKSPSKEMAKIGKFLDEGLAQGITKNKKKVTKATSELSADVVDSVKGIEEELNKINVAEKVKTLGGKVENPFDSWKNSDINVQINKLEKSYKSINESLIKNGVTQDQWSVSVEKTNERAKILEERLKTQNTLMDLFNAKIKKYGDNKAPEWVTKGIADLQKGIEVTEKEYEELTNVLKNNFSDVPETLLDKITNVATKMKSSFDDATKGIASAFKAVKEAIAPISNAFSDLYNQIMETIDMALQSEMDALDVKLQKVQEQTDEQIAIKENENKTELAELKNLLQKEAISYEEYTSRKEMAENSLALAKEKIEAEALENEKKINAEKNKIAEKQFNAEKANNIAMAIVQGALAIVKGFAELGPIGGAINAVLQAGITTAQVATIAQQEFVPMFAKGGVVNTPTLGIIGEAGKEVVMPLENNTEWINELAEKLMSFMQRDLSLGMAQPQLAYAGNPVVNNYNTYNQTINAPKQLTRREIYRDTKNLLALKGV